MGQVIAFPRRAEPEDDAEEVIAFKLMTAVDSAIKDLRELSLAAGSPTVRKRIDDCRRNLQRAFDTAVQEG